MAGANLKDRASIEAIYPLNVFRHDAGVNATGNTPVLHGLRILSEPDETGRFELVRANQHTGERDPEGDTSFCRRSSPGDLTALPESGQPAGEAGHGQDTSTPASSTG
jgi:hypothetical protein